MKKTTKLFVAIGCLTALTLVSQAQIIPISNGDFEANTTKTPFFDSTGAIIPGAAPFWTPTGPGTGGGWGGVGTGNSGIDMGSDTVPTMHMYLNQGDPSARNTTGTGLTVGDIYRADFVLAGTWNNYNNGNMFKTEVQLYADDGVGDRVVFATTDIITPGNTPLPIPYSVWGYNSLFEGTDGWNIGISFRNATSDNSPGSEGWSAVDDVTLQTDVPEPSTIALLTLGGLGALVGIRRRRA